MASVVNGSQVKLNDGKVIQAQQGGWYDGQQFWGGTLSQPGQINAQSNQQGAGQAVSREVIAQTAPQNVAYVEQQRAQQNLPPPPTVQNPTPQPVQQSAQTSSTSSGVSGGVSGGVTALSQPTINLPQLYESLYSQSGIRDIEAKLTEQTNAYNEQIAKIKDNPYLSEATMTGRIKKLDDKFSADSNAIQNQIAMKKADVETQLNLQTKQFDIQSDQAKLAWDQFNTLLQSGSLDNASGEDIAQLTRSTGISSSMIESAIQTSKAKNAPKVNTQVIQVDDGTTVSAVVINQDTGEVINRQVLGASTPTAAEQKPDQQSASEVKAQESQQNTANLTTDIKNKKTLRELITYYSQVLSIDDIYRLYNTYSPWGKAKETLAQVKQGKFVA